MYMKNKMSTPKKQKPQLFYKSGAKLIRRVIKNYTTKAPILDCGLLFISVVFIIICGIYYTKKIKSPKILGIGNWGLKFYATE